MSFVADKQTLDDLNILGRYKGDSIISLFDHTVTRGGGRMLESMFQHPLTNAALINTRTTIFKYFQETGMVFPVSRELCEKVEHYISTAGNNNLAVVASMVCRKKILQVIGSDPEYDMIGNGILAVTELLNAMSSFLAGVELNNNAGAYSKTMKEAQQILHSAGLETLLKEQGVAKLSLWKVITYDHLLRTVLQHSLKRLLELLYEMDVYITVARIARERKLVFAQAMAFETGKNQIEIDDLSHPRLAGAVPNTVHTSNDHNMIFLTGANMAGKSTFMKSFGIAIYLAHMGFPVAAARMVFSVQDGLYTSINVADNLNKGYSHFYAEVLRVKEVAMAVSQSNNLVIIFDELFKGTNVKDAYDATVAVTGAFAENRNVTIIVSTHIVEAGQALQQQGSNISFVFFPTILNKGIPHYTYKLQQGISDDRHGMMIITNEGIIDIIKGKGHVSDIE